MNRKQVIEILEKRMDDLETSALRGGIQRQGYITGTCIIAACSPGKVMCAFPRTKEYRFVEKMLLKRDYVKGRHDGKSLCGNLKLRQLSKIVDAFLENEFYEKVYGVKKKLGELK